MSGLLTVTAVIGVVTALGIVAAVGRRLRATTLLTAWRWAVGAALAWTVTLLASRNLGGWSVPSAIGEAMWYATALLSVCPAVAVLGARRPRIATWTWFVLVPLIAVLAWPVLAVWAIAPRPLPVQLEAPHVLGWLLVLLMGAGNYLGTKYWISACLYAAALVLLIASFSSATPGWLSAELMRVWASIAVALAVVAAWKAGRAPAVQPSIDRLMEDYCNLYGIVWGRRLQDRLNAVAQRQGWPVAVTPRGLVWEEEMSDSKRHETTTQVEQSLRWMLKPFVDPQWIDRRLTGCGGRREW
jgi:hypothetical protein